MKGRTRLVELDNEQLKKLDSYIAYEDIRSGIKRYKKDAWMELVKMVVAVIASIIVLNLGDMLLEIDTKTGGVLKSFYWCLLWIQLLAVVYIELGRINKTRRMFKEIANNNLYIDFIRVEQLFLNFNTKALENSYDNSPWCIVVYIENNKVGEKEALWVKWMNLDSAGIGG